MWVASTRAEVLSDFSEFSVGRMFVEVGELVERTSAGFRGAPLVLCEVIMVMGEPSGFVVEAAIPIDHVVPGSSRVDVRELPGVERMACTVYHGPRENMWRAAVALCNWIMGNGYWFCTLPDRDVYLHFDQDQPANSVIEVQIPVKRT